MIDNWSSVLRGGDKRLHLPLLGKKETTPVMQQKGCVGLRVGAEGEDQQRFVVPLTYMSHPLFLGLLKEAEEEYGFDQKGAITLPCHIEHFRQVQGIIDREKACGGHRGSSHHHHHPHHNILTSCFQA